MVCDRCVRRLWKIICAEVSEVAVTVIERGSPEDKGKVRR
jgi:hypothetical protein